MMKLPCVAMVLALATAACGGEAENGQKACTILVDCKVKTQAVCAKEWAVLELTSECVEAMGAVDCQEHSSPSPSYLDTCFLPCSGESVECRGGKLMTCIKNRMMVIRCAAGCLAEGASYTGTCGLTYQGRVSKTPACWCEVKE